MQIGQLNSLTCQRLEGDTAWLADASGTELRLADADDLPAVGDTIDAFVFTDANAEPVATSRHPKVLLGGCASLKVVAEGPGGMFLDWGLDKHLLLPFAEQRRPLEVGRAETILVYLDNSGRLAASSRLDHHLPDRPEGFIDWQQVDLLLYQRTELGYKAVVDNRAIGLIYGSDVFQHVRPGLQVNGWVKRVREDGRLDLALQPPARDLVDPLAQRVLDWLAANDGIGELTDKSSPESIKAEFQVSKKNFKRALSQLYKQRRVLLEPGRVVLVTDDDSPVGEVEFPEPR